MDPSRLEQVLQRWRHSIHTGEAFELEFPLRGADERAPRGVPLLPKPVDLDALSMWMERLCHCRP